MGVKTITEEKKFVFLAELREGSTVTAAAQKADINRRSLYDIRDREPEFRALWEMALEEGADRVQDEVRDRAFDRSDPKSATLLIFLLKGLRPQFKENFRDRPIQIEHVKEYTFSKTEMDEALLILQNAKSSSGDNLSKEEHTSESLQEVEAESSPPSTSP